MVLGNCSSKTRGWISAVSWVATSWFDDAVALADGQRRQPQRGRCRPPPRPAARKPAPATITRRLETPAARMAVISPSLDMRPSPIRMPTSTPKGMVKGSTGGQDQREQLADRGRAGRAAHQQLEQLVPRRCRNMTKVASSVPRRRSRGSRGKRSGLRIRMARVPEGGGTSGSLGSSSSARVQFQVVDQDRRRDHARFRRCSRRRPSARRARCCSGTRRRCSSSPAARMSLSERAFRPRKRRPRTSSSRPSG